MKDFLDWKLGDKQLPAKCVLITIDDGWKSVYTDAYPILREMKIPFTVFPYTKFITGRGSAMSREQIQEMLNNGATLGSHSVSHLYPRSWRAAQRKGTQAVLDLAAKEIGESRKILQERFPGSDVEAYCYPGGFVLPEMITKAEEAGFRAAFTVIPRKVTKDTDRWRIHRYMVFGKDPKTFTRAVNSILPARRRRPPPLPQAMNRAGVLSGSPPSRLPGSQHRGPQPESGHFHFPCTGTAAQSQGHEMRVSGFGLVNAKYDAREKVLKWAPSRPLRISPVTVQVRWKVPGGNIWQTATWQFGIAEQEMHFIPGNLVK